MLERIIRSEEYIPVTGAGAEASAISTSSSPSDSLLDSSLESLSSLDVSFLASFLGLLFGVSDEIFLGGEADCFAAFVSFSVNMKNKLSTVAKGRYTYWSQGLRALRSRNRYYSHPHQMRMMTELS